jgi:hypothetical protein
MVLQAIPAKSFAVPIRCSPELLLDLEVALPCLLGTLPCSYLGLPLSLRKPGEGGATGHARHACRKAAFLEG